MSLDRYAKLELLIRTEVRRHFVDKLSTAKQKAVLVPGFDVPRGETVDLIVPPRSGLLLCISQRSDYVVVYKHTIGQIVGTLAHFHRMSDRQVREALRAAQARPDVEEGGEIKIDVVKLSKRLIADRQKGAVKVVLATDLPEVPQQARELEANFAPVADLLQAWVTTPLNKRKLSLGVELYAVNPHVEPAQVAPLWEAIKAL